MSTVELYRNYFAFDAEHYQRDTNVFQHYILQSAKALHDRTGRPMEVCVAFVRKSLKPGGAFPFKDPKVTFLQRKENGDREPRETTLSKYIGESVQSRDIIAPTFTTYIDPRKKESLLAKFIRKNIKMRGVAKKAMFKAKADKNHDLEKVKETEQKGRKTSNNSLSGAHISASTPLRNKTAHSSLTSICRTTSAYGNANNEKFVAGNRHYHSYNVTLNNLVAIANAANLEKIQAVIEKYNLHVPSVDDVMDCITYSTQLYWWDRSKMAKLKEHVMVMKPMERAAFVYTSDFFHLRKHNQEFVFNFITRLSNKVTGVHPDPLATMKKAPENYVNLAHQICFEEAKGIGKEYDKVRSPEDLHTLAMTVQNIAECVYDHRDMIEALWMPKTLPASVSNFPASIRRTALTSDTDSTIFTVQDWMNWYGGGKLRINRRTHSVYCAVVFLSAATITHILAMMSANLGVVTERIFDILMKNEFSFDVFIPTNLGKHYFAAISCQEGQVNEEFEYERKGVGLKSANTPRETLAQADKMMEDIIHDTVTDMSISLYKYLNQVADAEQAIAKDILSGGLKYYRSGSIKDAGSYAGEPDRSPYQAHFLWNEVFGPKYGEMPLPPYSTVKVSVETDSPSLFKAWLDKMEDRELAERMRAYCLRQEKSHISTFNLPTDIVMSVGLPKEIFEQVDYLKMVKDICKIFYLLLETLGFYTKSTVSEAIGLKI